MMVLVVELAPVLTNITVQVEQMNQLIVHQVNTALELGSKLHQVIVLQDIIVLKDLILQHLLMESWEINAQLVVIV